MRRLTIIEMRTICKQCGKTYYYNRKHRKGHHKTMCSTCVVSNARRKRKKQSVDYKGGKCILCGYNKCLNALHFHHLESEEKEFGLSYRGLCRSWEKIKKELDKCILVCANCHAEIHEKLIYVPG